MTPITSIVVVRHELVEILPVQVGKSRSHGVGGVRVMALRANFHVLFFQLRRDLSSSFGILFPSLPCDTTVLMLRVYVSLVRLHYSVLTNLAFVRENLSSPAPPGETVVATVLCSIRGVLVFVVFRNPMLASTSVTSSFSFRVNRNETMCACSSVTCCVYDRISASSRPTAPVLQFVSLLGGLLAPFHVGISAFGRLPPKPRSRFFLANRHHVSSRALLSPS